MDSITQGQQKSCEVKMALLGDTGVGKTAVAIRFISRMFDSNIASTSGATYFKRSVEVNGNTAKLMLFDTAGQERFRSLCALYFRSAEAVIIIYDVTRAATFEDVKYWVSEVQQKGTEGVRFYMVGNKIDRENREVTKEAAQAYAASIKAKYFECSALTGEGVDQIFYKIAEEKLADPVTKKPVTLNVLETEEKSGCCK